MVGLRALDAIILVRIQAPEQYTGAFVIGPIPAAGIPIYYVYFLLLNNSNIYTGITADLKRRIFEHKNGKVAATKHLRPLQAIAYEAYLLKSDALRREKFLKTNEGKRSIRCQIKDVFAKYHIVEGSPCYTTGRPIE